MITCPVLSRCDSIDRMMVIARRIRDFLADDQFLRGNYASTMWKSLLGQCYPEFSHMELEDILLTICARAVSNQEPRFFITSLL